MNKELINEIACDCEKCNCQNDIEENEVITVLDAENSEPTDGYEMMEDFAEMLFDYLKVDLNKENIEDCQINKNEFQKGINKVSEVAGMFTTLINVGMDIESAITFILNERNIEHSQKMQKIINEGQVEISKFSKVVEDMNRI